MHGRVHATLYACTILQQSGVGAGCILFFVTQISYVNS